MCETKGPLLFTLETKRIARLVTINSQVNDPGQNTVAYTKGLAGQQWHPRVTSIACNGSLAGRAVFSESGWNIKSPNIVANATNNKEWERIGASGITMGEYHFSIK